MSIPKRIWVGSFSNIGVYDTGYWFSSKNSAAQTEYMLVEVSDDAELYVKTAANADIR